VCAGLLVRLLARKHILLAWHARVLQRDEAHRGGMQGFLGLIWGSSRMHKTICADAPARNSAHRGAP